MAEDALSVGPYTLSPDDFRALARAVRWPFATLVLREVNPIATFVGFIAIVYFIAREILGAQGMSDWFEDHDFAFLILGVVLGAIYLFLSQRFLGAAALADPAVMPRSRLLLISPRGIEGSVGETKSSLPWGDVVRVAVTKNHIFIFLTRTAALIAPTRAFASAGAAKLFEDKAREWFAAARPRA